MTRPKLLLLAALCGLTTTVTGTAAVAAGPATFARHVNAPTGAAAGSSAVAPLALKPIRALVASHISTSSVNLAWTNASGLKFAGVLIRESRGKTPPKSPTAGHRVASLTKRARTYTVTRLKPATTYSFAVFARYGRKFAAPATVAVTTRGLPMSAVDVSAGDYVTCAVLSTGTVKCWGWGGGGMLGDGRFSDSSTPIVVSGITTAKAVAVGTDSVCALLGAGTVKCWGDDYWGELGNGRTSPSPIASPVTVSGLSAVRQIAVGLRSACALTGVGAVKCWGDNELDMLGDNHHEDASDVPVSPTGLTSDVAQLAVGYNSDCVVMTDRTAKCWGDNTSGQIGINGGPASVSTPQTVTGLSNAVQVAVGYAGACVTTTAHAVECWGAGTSSSTPVAMTGWESGIAAVASGGDIEFNICALSATGAATCEGDDFYGDLGDGTTGLPTTTPSTVSGLSSGVGKLSVGLETVCAITRARGVDCWGYNNYGQLGIGSTAIDAITPVAVKL